MKNQTQSNTLKRLEKIMMTNYKSQVSKKKAKTTVGKTLQAPLIPADSTYFGKTIHKVYYNNRWYYSLEDIATMSSPLVLVLKIYQIEKQLNKNLSFFVILSGLLFTLSESIFYLINIFALGDLTMIPKRFFFTGILHIGTLMLIYIFGRKNNVGLLIILLFSIVIHYLYNQWAGNFF